jgi:endonuclease/exonuclease/phosphatase family metal-dependent hydrolase
VAAFVVVAATVIGWRFFGAEVRDAAGIESTIPARPVRSPDGARSPGDPRPPSVASSDSKGTEQANPARVGVGGTMRIATWNLRNFGAKHQKHDLERLRAQLDTLDADVIAVQEIVDPEALRRVRPDWELTLSRGGGRGGQHLGLWADPARARVVEGRDEARISLGGTVRPAFVARVADTHDASRDLGVIVVHLKARPEGADARRRQWPSLVELVGELARADSEVVVLGDFNVTGGDDRDAAAELVDLEKTLSRADLHRVPVRGGCSAYWQGRKRDQWLEPSLLDLVWVRGVTTPGPAHPGAHCGAHTCQTFRSSRAYPDLDYRGISDHCPVVVDLRWP